MPIITELIEDKGSRSYFGNDKRAINRHSTRQYDYVAGGKKVCRVMLDRTTDAIPPVFCASFIPSPEFVGILPECKVTGLRYFADGMPWRKAESFLKESLDYKYRNNELQETA